MRAVHVVVTGIVQRVGFRAFVAREAGAAGVDGWVRNRRDGSVEAVIAGEDGVVEAVLAAVRRGPPGARVDEVRVTAHAGEVTAGFGVLGTE